MPGEAPEAADLAAVLAPILKPDRQFNLVLLGEAQEAVLNGRPVADELRVAYEAVRGHPALGGRCLMAARRKYNEHMAEQVRAHGGMIITDRFHGGRRVERTVERFPRRTSDPSNPVARPRTRARSRGAGRPAARRAAGNRSGSDPGEDGPSEPSRETPAEQIARRFRRLEAFVARHGLDWWDHHTDPPADLDALDCEVSS
jgi:hypothetical protein